MNEKESFWLNALSICCWQTNTSLFGAGVSSLEHSTSISVLFFDDKKEFRLEDADNVEAFTNGAAIGASIA